MQEIFKNAMLGINSQSESHFVQEAKPEKCRKIIQLVDAGTEAQPVISRTKYEIPHAVK